MGRYHCVAELIRFVNKTNLSLTPPYNRNQNMPVPTRNQSSKSIIEVFCNIQSKVQRRIDLKNCHGTLVSASFQKWP